MTIEKIEYKHVIEKENQLFALYYPRGRNTNNQEVEAEVIAYFCFIKSKKLFNHFILYGYLSVFTGLPFGK